MESQTLSTQALSSLPPWRGTAHYPWTVQQPSQRSFVRPSRPLMRARATRGFSGLEMHQVAGRGMDAEAKAEARRMEFSQVACGIGGVPRGRIGGCSNRREEAAACQVQLHTAASFQRGEGS